MLTSMIIALMAVAGGAANAVPLPRVTVLYDNTSAVSGTRADWGFACLVETPGGSVLFDVGAKDEVLRHNLRALEVSLDGVRAVVISHLHGDHTGGLAWVVAQQPGVTVYVPAALPDSLQRSVGEAARIVTAKAPAQIVDGVWTTGEVEGDIPEQALVVETARGAVVITGCAHPGVATLVQRAAGAVTGSPYMVLGGFHLGAATPKQVNEVIAELEALGVQRVAPGHCTGEKAIALFRVAFGDHFTPLGVGRVIALGE